MASAILMQTKAQLPLEVNFDNGSYLPLQLRYGPNDNPSQQDTSYTVKVQGGKAHLICPTSTAQIRLSGFLDLPQAVNGISGNLNHRWTFTNVSDFNVLGTNAIAGCYIRGEMNHWVGGMFGDYWFGMIVTSAGKVSVIRQGTNNLQTEPFTAIDSVSYEIRKIGDSKLQLWAKYDNAAWHQVGNEITITLNTSTSGANYNVAVTHVRILNNNGNKVDVAIDNMLWWQPSTTSLIEANASKKIDAYPNPASNYIYFSNLLPQHKIYFFDAMGRQVIFFNEPSEIDITSLSNGIYFVKIFDGQDKVVGSTKILKQ
jgi:hypothetical protein